MRTFYEGEWAGQEVVLVLSRIGKVSAAVTTLLLVERFGATHVVFTGMAGAVDPALRIGDVVIAERLVQHDMDARPLFPRHEIPLLGRTEFAATLDEAAFVAAREYMENCFAAEVSSTCREAFRIDRPAVHRGLIASGDQFIAHPERRAALQADLPGVRCTEMEGAAVAQVCYEMGNLPVAVIRVISDEAGHGAAIDFQRFMNEVAEFITGGIVRVLLERWTAEKAKGIRAESPSHQAPVA